MGTCGGYISAALTLACKMDMKSTASKRKHSHVRAWAHAPVKRSRVAVAPAVPVTQQWQIANLSKLKVRRTAAPASALVPAALDSRGCRATTLQGREIDRLDDPLVRRLSIGRTLENFLRMAGSHLLEYTVSTGGTFRRIAPVLSAHFTGFGDVIIIDTVVRCRIPLADIAPLLALYLKAFAAD